MIAITERMEQTRIQSKIPPPPPYLQSSQVSASDFH